MLPCHIRKLSSLQTVCSGIWWRNVVCFFFPMIVSCRLKGSLASPDTLDLSNIGDFWGSAILGLAFLLIYVGVAAVYDWTIAPRSHLQRASPLSPPPSLPRVPSRDPLPPLLPPELPRPSKRDPHADCRLVADLGRFTGSLWCTL